MRTRIRTRCTTVAGGGRAAALDEGRFETRTPQARGGAACEIVRGSAETPPRRCGTWLSSPSHSVGARRGAGSDPDTLHDSAGDGRVAAFRRRSGGGGDEVGPLLHEDAAALEEIGAHAGGLDRAGRLGQRQLQGSRTRGLKGKHVEALVGERSLQGISTDTKANRVAHIRWWARNVGKPGVVRPSKAAYGIVEMRSDLHQGRTTGDVRRAFPRS